jgi:hypothetical protein
MELYLDHPEHGARVVYSHDEASSLAAAGWKVRNPQPGQKPIPEPKIERVVGVDTDGDGVIDKPFKKRGAK